MVEKYHLKGTKWYNVMKLAKEAAGKQLCAKWMDLGEKSGHFTRTVNIPEFSTPEQRTGTGLYPTTCLAKLDSLFLFMIDIASSGAEGRNCVLKLLKPSFDIIVNKTAYCRAVALYCMV